MCVNGEAEVSISGNAEKISEGQTVLIPAETRQIKIKSEGAELLEIYVDQT